MTQHTIGPLIIDIEGFTLTPADRQLLAHPYVGGVILFTRNYQTPQQLSALVQNIKDVDPHLLVTVDQEGGRIQRFREGFTPLPSLRHLGEQYDRDPAAALQFADDCGWMMATELLALGVDISFAPVLDIDYGLSEVIGSRSFHREPATIVALAARYIAGLRRAGMVAIGKHFPGHGGVRADTHTDQVIDERDEQTLQTEDLQPFLQLIQQHLLDGIMPSHVIYQAVAPEPAGFSAYWLQTVLREQLGFQGMIFSDDLSMRAAETIDDLYTRVLRARSAGCDFVLICNNHDDLADVLDQLEKTQQPLTPKPLNFYGHSEYTYQQLPQSTAWQEVRQNYEWHNYRVP